MEFKILSDQFNSACEDFGLGIPQANGYPFQDELYRRKSFEPEFLWGLRSGNGEWYKAESLTKANIDTEAYPIKYRTQRIFEKITAILKEKDDVYEISVPEENYLSTFNGVQEILEGVNISTSFLHFVEPENGNHRRFWSIRLCNCGKITKDINSDCVEQYEKCHTFTISWNPNLKLDKQKEVASELWYVFELVPKLKEYEELTCVPKGTISNSMTPSLKKQKACKYYYSKDEGFKVLNSEFESLWKEIDAKEPDKELSTSTDDEDDTPSDVLGPAKDLSATNK
eukprot:GHVP01027564.1.p1 GENE.GHVP01027564.1~~GHVP01027564.1.p1  ORF type:complete len:292 (+),score=39.94 GHVP01027564.1:26-877(+)